MNYLVVFYSRTGLTRKVGESISDLLQCDREEIYDKKNRDGISGQISSGIEALLKKRAKIKEPVKDPAKYDLIIVGTPVWSMSVSSPVRSYLFRHRGKFKEVAFFATGGTGSTNAFREMGRICGKKPLAVMEIAQRDRADGEGISKIKEYIEEIKR